MSSDSAEDGRLSVFIDPNGIFGRPRAIKTLKSLNASISSNPKDAHVIVVNPQADSGVQFLRDWGSSPGKVVLDYTWVEKCKAAGELLTEDDDNWGGCRASDDGRPISSLDDDEDITATTNTRRPPLPTPRTTPSYPAQQASSTPLAPYPPASQSSPNPLPSQTTSSQLMPLSGQFPLVFNNPSDSQHLLPILQQLPQSVLVQALLQQASPSTFSYNSPFALALQDSIELHRTGGFSNNINQYANNPLLAPPLETLPVGNVAESRGSSSSAPSRSLKRKRQAPNATVDQRANSSSASLDKPSKRPQTAKIFMLGKKPVTFFVSTELSDRKKLLKLIDQHGGSRTDTPSESDVALLDRDSTIFRQHWGDCLSADIPAVRKSFIEECISRGEYLNPYDFLLHPPEVQKRKRRSPTKKVVPKSPKRYKTPEKCSDDEQDVRKTKQHAALSSRTPTPPPESSRQQLADGARYYFTDAEWDFAFRYIRVLFTRDAMRGMSEIARDITNKLPHHPEKSWCQVLSKRRHEIDAIRDEVQAALREQSMVGESSDESDDGEPLQLLLKNDKELSIEDDLNTMCNFLAFEGGDTHEEGETDEDVLGRLKVPCKSAGSWIEFHNKHHKAIFERYSALIQQEET